MGGGDDNDEVVGGEGTIMRRWLGGRGEHNGEAVGVRGDHDEEVVGWQRTVMMRWMGGRGEHNEEVVGGGWTMMRW